MSISSIIKTFHEEKHVKVLKDSKAFDNIQLLGQALTTLNLDRNNIDHEGAQNLAQTLQNNIVKQILYLSAASTLLFFNIDTHYAQP
jgi:hypothetical protein